MSYIAPAIQGFSAIRITPFPQGLMMGRSIGWLAVSMPKNLLVPQAHNAKIVRFGTGSLPEETDLQPSQDAQLFVRLWGDFRLATVNPSHVWKSLGSAETTGPLPGWDSDLSSCQTTRALAGPQSPHLQLTVF